MTYTFYVPSAPHSGQCLLVWNAKSGDGIPAPLAAWTREQTGYALTGNEQVSFVEGINAANGKPLRLGYAQVDQCHGN